MFNSVNFFTKIIRPIAAALDKLIYGLVGWILSGILELSNLMTSETFAQTIYKNIYILLAVFMVFKLTFSFIQYLVSPDKMLDKDQGVGKLVTNTIVMLMMLILLPIIFFQPMISTGCEDEELTLLNALQQGVLNTLPNIILGESNDVRNQVDACTNTTSNRTKEEGEALAVDMLSSLFVINDEKKQQEDEDARKENKEVQYRITSFDDFTTKVSKYTGDYFDYDYMFPVTTIAGIVLVVVLIGIAIDVAIRAFKLIILQIIAPIPVMTYIDPKSSKDGAFNSWIKNFISTYLDLFVKIGSVYVLLLLIQKLKLFDSGGIFGEGIKNIQTLKTRTFVRVFLVIGLFKFAKDAPKFVKDAMGIKDNGSGGGSMGKMLSGMAGAAAGFAGGVATGGLAGGISGLAGGFAAGKAGKAGEAFSQVRDEQAKLLGKTPGGLKGKIQNKAMQRSVMKHTGLDKDALKKLKNDKITADNELALAKANLSKYNENDLTGNLNDDGTDETYAQAYEKAAAKAGQANSAYEGANSLAQQIGMKPGFMKENARHGKLYTAVKNSVPTVWAKGRVKEGVENIKDLQENIEIAPARLWHGQRLKSDAKKHGVDKAIDLYADRMNIREAKEDLRGGVAAPSPEDASEALAKAREQYKNDKP